MKPLVTLSPLLSFVLSHLHGVSLATGCLSIGKDRSVVAAENIFDDLFRCFVVDFLLGGIRPKDFVEDVDFPLEGREDSLRASSRDLH